MMAAYMLQQVFFLIRAPLILSKLKVQLLESRPYFAESVIQLPQPKSFVVLQRGCPEKETKKP